MSEEALRSVCAPGATAALPPLPPLCAPSLDAAAASNQLELEMRLLVAERRKVSGGPPGRGTLRGRLERSRPWMF